MKTIRRMLSVFIIVTMLLNSFSNALVLNAATNVSSGSAFSSALRSGDVTLTADITVSGNVVIESGSHVLDLNGHNLTLTNNTAITLNGGSLTVKDSQNSTATKTAVTNKPLYGNTASYSSGTLTYYVTESNLVDGKTGFTEEKLYKYTAAKGLVIGNNNNRCFQVNGGTLNLEGGYFCNFNKSDNGSVVYATGTKTVINVNGAVIAANKARRGAIFASTSATLNINDGIIAGNTAVKGNNSIEGGGGVYGSSATINMNGGYVTNNISNATGYNDGGGAFLLNATTLNINGGYITGNQAAGGGGIKTYYNTKAVINMNGGFVSSNNAVSAEAGGINVDAKGILKIDAGYITNNIAGTGVEDTEFQHWGGGGIFCCQSDAIIYISSVLITGNKAGGFGGGVAGCSTGRISVVLEDGGAIFDNYAPDVIYDDAGNMITDHIHLSGGASRKNEDHTYAIKDSTFLENGYHDFYCALSSIVSGGILGGGKALWTGSADGQPVVTEDVDNIVEAGYIMGLTSNASDFDKQNAINTANVFITGNESPTHGGGILANGYLMIGNQDYITTYARLELNASKSLLDQTGKKLTQQGNEFSFNIIDVTDVADGDASKGIIVATGVNDGSGNITFDKRLAFTGGIAVGGTKVYTYYINEVIGDNQSILYDASRYKLDVTVKNEKETVGSGSTALTKYVYKFTNIKLTELNNGKVILNNSNPKNDESHAVELDLTKNVIFKNTGNSKTSIEVNKVWADGTAGRDKVTVTLKANGTATATVELNAGNNWSYRWDNLDASKTYTVEEAAIAGYTSEVEYEMITETVTANGVTAYHLVNKATITNTEQKTSISGSKSWNDGNNGDNTRPDSITVILKANGTEKTRKTVYARDNWAYSFDNLPIYDKEGKQINYTVEEVAVANYDPSYNGTNISNTLVTTVSGSKSWNDGGANKPANITVILKADGSEKARVTVTAENNWSYSFENLPVYSDTHKIVYTVEEVGVEGYLTSVDGYNIVNTATTEISGTKSWNDGNGANRPAEITVNLLVNGVKTVSTKTNAQKNWAYSFTDLAKYDVNGNLINYSVSEDAVSGYRSEQNGNDFVNTELTSVSGTKTWNDGNSANRPASITVRLYANGVEKDLKQVSATDNWNYSFTGLDKYDADGKLIEYTVSEDAVTGYRSAQNGNNFVNTELTSVSGTKTWNDGNSANRPASITVRLYANGVKKESKQVSASDNWSYSFTGLDKYDADGKLIEYTVSEDAVTGYRSAQNGNNFVNTELTSVSGTKTWNDGNNADKSRPASITVYLMVGEEVKDSKVVTAGDKWAYTFDNLDKYDASGNLITYSIKEEAVGNYETTYNGNDIVNTELTSVSGSKIWNDGNGANRPAEITVNLLVNGVKTVSTKTNAQKNWAYSFDKLAKYDANGVLIDYTVTEESVSNYRTEYVVNSYDIKNTELTEISGTKSWADGDDKDETRPESITVYLMVGEETKDSKVVTADNNWSYLFDNLDKYDANGEEITYSVKEDTTALTDYVVSYDGNNIINTRVTEISGTKTWYDSGDKRPSSIIVTLYANEEPIDEKEVSEATNWSYSFFDLVKYDGQGNEISYTVSESIVEGYKNEQIGNDFVNTELTEVSGQKTWIDNNNQDGKRPSEITVNLLANGEKVASAKVEADENGDWKYSFTGLVKYDSEGKLITYSVTEDKVEHYDAAVNGYNITNTHTPGKITISGEKSWDDNNDQDGKRPTEITVNLFADGEKINSVKVEADEEGNWSYAFTNLDEYKDGKKVVYTVNEDEVSEYEIIQDGYNFTNKHNPEKTRVDGVKSWDDKDDQDGKRPASITVRLWANGKEVASKVVTADDKWNYSFTDLDKYADKKEIEYTVTEDPVSEYTTEIDCFNIINCHTPEKVTIDGSKFWEDENNQDGIRPEKITLNLLADGKVIDTVVVMADEEGNWKYEFIGFDKYKEGVEIKYTVEEVAIEGYEVSYEGYDVINTHAPETTEIEVKKYWDDNNNQDGIRPESITVILLANGQKYGMAVITETVDWKVKFTDLPKYKEGKEVEYTIDEIIVDGYTTIIDGYNITNTHTPELTTVSGTKSWDDSNNQDGKRVEEITVYLYGDGVKLDEVTVNKDTEWNYEFTDLPKYKDGKEIKYTVVESKVEGYTATYDGYDIINTYKPELTSINVIKVWDDEDDLAGKRPVSITINLFADEQLISTVTLSEENNWEVTFADLAKYSEGKEIVYTVSEDEVEYYDSSIEVEGDVVFILNTYIPEIPYTGDETNIAAWSLLAGLSIVGLLAGLYIELKSAKKEY